jgi:hypothetical protein
MVWTTGVALILAGYRALVDLSDRPPSHRSFLLVAQVIYSMVYGASLGGLGILARRRYRGGSPFPLQPGHWYLILSGVATILAWAGYAVAECVYPRGDASFAYQWARYRFYCIVRFPDYAALLVLSLVASRNCSRRYWIRFFEVGALFTVFNAVATWIVVNDCRHLRIFGPLDLVQATGAVVLPLLMMVAVALDWRACEKRDWLHWCGVAVGVVGGLFNLTWIILENLVLRT